MAALSFSGLPLDFEVWTSQGSLGCFWCLYKFQNNCAVSNCFTEGY